jgi:tRNA(adenine34) deaminase
MSAVDFSPDDQRWMNYAISLAKTAAQQNEVPVGAVLVKNNELIGEGHNAPISQNDPTAHAEIIAMRRAAQQLGNYRLIDSTLYVTLEPCAMCAAAMVHARITRLVFGASDPKAGAVISQARLMDAPYFNHRISYTNGLYDQECGHLLSEFFKARR